MYTKPDQTRQQIEAYFEEFSFLNWVVNLRKTCGVKVKRVTFELTQSSGDFYLFNRKGQLIWSYADEMLADALKRAGIDNVGYVVQRVVNNPSMYGYGLFTKLSENWLGGIFSRHITYFITVYKPMKEDELEKWLKYDDPSRIRAEVRQKIDEA